MDNAKKKWVFIPFILASLGIPYAVFDGGLDQIKSYLGQGKSNLPAYDPLAGNLPIEAQGTGFAIGGVPTGATPRPSNQRLEGPVVNDLMEVIRFDISPRWVAEHWARVSTVTADLQLEGLRVPLVSGPKPDDLAGSLTYYFDKQHTVQRVTFHGTTGDERRLVQLLTSVYGFREQPSVGGAIFVTMNNGKPTSLLRVSSAPIVRATLPNSQREVMLEINRPGTFAALSPDMRTVLEHDANVRRW